MTRQREVLGGRGGRDNIVDRRGSRTVDLEPTVDIDLVDHHNKTDKPGKTCKIRL